MRVTDKGSAGHKTHLKIDVSRLAGLMGEENITIRDTMTGDPLIGGIDIEIDHPRDGESFFYRPPIECLNDDIREKLNFPNAICDHLERETIALVLADLIRFV